MEEFMRPFSSLCFRLIPVVAVAGMALSNTPVQAAVFDDNFTGTTLGKEWTQNIPVAGPTITVNNGLVFTTPDSQAFDNWNTVANAPEIFTPAPQGDFTVSAQVGSIVDPNGDPVEGQSYHAALTVNFSKFDILVIGDYRSNTFIQLERSGINTIGTATLGTNPNFVQIKKTGNDYTFFYKEQAADPWTPLPDANGDPVVITIPDKAPVSTGLMLKTWGNVGATATFKNFHLEADSLSLPATLQGKVTVTGGTPDQVRVQLIDSSGKIHGVAIPAADGSYSITVGSGTYKVQLSGDTGVSSSPGASKDGVVISPSATTTLDLTAALPPPADLTTNVIFQDDFAGSALKTAWSTLNDAGNISVDGKLHFVMPEGPFDHWTGFNNAPQIYMKVPAGDFIATAKLDSVVDPDGKPVEGLNYHSALTVYFDTDHYEALIWGAYLSNKTIRFERTGAGVGSGTIVGLPAWVQIRKSGNNYTFFYRTSDTSAWTPLFGEDGNPLVYTRTDLPEGTLTPIDLGLEQKTWGDGAALTATWSRFILQSNIVGPPPGTLGDLNGDGKVNVQDATTSLRIAVGSIIPTDAQKAAGDVNHDGKWNVQDTTLILRFAVGAITAFP
jgi:hypothetical protein